MTSALIFWHKMSYFSTIFITCIKEDILTWTIRLLHQYLEVCLYTVNLCPSPGIVALWSLAVLAFERYFVICRPLGNIRLRGKHAALGLLFVWTFSFIWTIPPVLGWSSYTISRIGTTCEPNWWGSWINSDLYVFLHLFVGIWSRWG